eukprot:6185754-Pleurochrysis_carterae.AAC.3
MHNSHGPMCDSIPQYEDMLRFEGRAEDIRFRSVCFSINPTLPPARHGCWTAARRAPACMRPGGAWPLRAALREAVDAGGRLGRRRRRRHDRARIPRRGARARSHARTLSHTNNRSPDAVRARALLHRTCTRLARRPAFQSTRGASCSGVFCFCFAPCFLSFAAP